MNKKLKFCLFFDKMECRNQKEFYISYDGYTDG